MPYADALLAYDQWGILILRVVLGIIFLVHGIPKLFGPQPGIAGFSGWLRSMRVPLAGLFGALVPLIEFSGGIALILGFLVQPFALLLGVIMVVASVLKATKMGKKFTGDGGWEFDLVILAGTIVLLTAGAGAYTLDAWVF